MPAPGRMAASARMPAAMPDNPPTLDSDLVIELESSPAITTPFVREDEQQTVERRPSTFGDSYLHHSAPMSLGRKLMLLGGLLALGAIGFFGYLIFFGERPGQAAAPTVDATVVAVADAAPPADAALPDAPPIAEKLTIASKPEGATVYLDGTLIGETPISVDGTRDKHKLAVILAGHKLHVAESPGAGDVMVELEEVTPSAGAGGIKVRCKTKNRYYVFVDGRDSGMLCPTERIGVKKAPHVVEIYDPITDTRSRFDVEIKQTRRSTRVRVD